MAGRKSNRRAQRLVSRVLARMLLAGAIFLTGIAFYAGFVEPYFVVLEEREILHRIREFREITAFEHQLEGPRA